MLVNWNILVSILSLVSIKSLSVSLSPIKKKVSFSMMLRLKMKQKMKKDELLFDLLGESIRTDS